MIPTAIKGKHTAQPWIWYLSNFQTKWYIQRTIYLAG